MNLSRKINVIVIDDSALVRKILTAILNEDHRLNVVASAADPYEGRKKIERFSPDVIILDIEIPRMDGINFLRNLMRLRPVPVVMVSTLTEYDAPITLEALELGAFDFIEKPKVDVARGFAAYAQELVGKVIEAAGSRMPLSYRLALQCLRYTAPTKNITEQSHPTRRLVVIGASTGGVEALRHLLCAMPVHAPGIVIVQHIPASFSASLAARLDTLTSVRVCEASDGERIMTGCVYIAAGDRHLKVKRRNNDYYCEYDDGPPVSRHKPSANVLFESVARCAGPAAIGVILTGMGNDGARGLQKMKQAGAINLAQDEATSIVWGMPGAAVHADAVNIVCPLLEIADCILVLSGQDQGCDRHNTQLFDSNRTQREL